MQRDIREGALFREAESICRALRKPATGSISDAAELSAHGVQVAFAGSLVDTLNGVPRTRVCLLDLTSGDTRVMTFGPNDDRQPKFSPDGHQIAFLSDRHEPGDSQLYLLDPISGVARPTPRVDGWVEYLHWSPDGKRILLGVAGRGADVAGGQGAVTSKRASAELPPWMPVLGTGDGSYRWRRVWLYELATDAVRQVGPANINSWEAAWCGNEALAVIASPGPEEGLWYSAHLHILELANGESRRIYKPQYQLGWPGCSPSGKHLAVVEALCSDRWIVAGDLLVIEATSGRATRIDTHGIDITYTEWRSDQTLLLAGHRGFETVVGLYDTASDTFTEVWRDCDTSTGGRYIAVSGVNEKGDCVLVGESFVKAPEIAEIRNGDYRAVKSFDQGYGHYAQAIRAVDRLTWSAADGLQIQGWLLRPEGRGPYPLVMYVHGGPVWHWRPFWLGRGAPSILMLLKRGYAVFFPNPRGGAGRGQSFTRQVVGDMGGADAFDCLSGVDYLVTNGIADPKRLGLTGASYGGFMTSWLITQDTRFAAAVAVAPITNQVTLHLISNIPDFVSIFLADHYTNPGGRYFQRSPIMHASRATTPVLSICGALDRCTPPEEAQQFHSALLENGVKSVLVTYPQEGHGIRNWPAAFDYAARVVGWFEEHMPAINPH
jgi:dipeptidyl aminopeptidase/acylaminoacyl peptidase